MIVYHFLPELYALDNLRKRHLKISFIEDMNDPFELLGGSLENKQHRNAFLSFKKDMNTIFGALCFSKHWSNPVLWSHYADKHKGCCLGFEIPDDIAMQMSYEAKRLKMDIEERLKSGETIGSDLSSKLLTTKFEDWKYEEEIRVAIKPEEFIDESGLKFYKFQSDLVLKEIILGARSTLSIQKIKSAVQIADYPVDIIRTRLAFKSFTIVHNKEKPIILLKPAS